MNFKDIYIGQIIEQRVIENKIELPRICNFFKRSEEEIEKMYMQSSLDTEILLKWSKLLEYDFFRLYSQHLILYAPPITSDQKKRKQKRETTVLPQFRKNLYTKEVIDFIMEQIDSDKMTVQQVIEQYSIPKTTLYKWRVKRKS